MTSSNRRYVRGSAILDHPSRPVHPEGKQAENRQSVIDTLEQFLAAMRIGDPKAWEELMYPQGMAFRVAIDEDGRHRMMSQTLAQMIERLREKWVDQVEHFIGVDVRIEGPIAAAWAPYDFWLNGEFHHNGTISVQLVRDEERWRIANVTWTVEGADGFSADYG